MGSSVQRVYTYGVNRISQSQLVSGVWTTSFYGYDGQGSVRFLLDTGGNITDRYTYDAFGNEVAVSGATPNVYRYVGEAFDQGLQLTYLRARYLNRATGRFWTADAAGGDAFDPAGLHRYLYAGGDPVNNSDPLGLFTTMMGDAVHFYLGVHFMATGVKRDLFRFFDDQSKGGLRPALWKIAANVAGGAAVKLAKATTGLDRIPDLVDLTNKALFEIKPIGKRAGGARSNRENVEWLNDLKVLGEWRVGAVADYNPPTYCPCDYGYTCIARVFPPDVDGVITYDEVDLTEARIIQ